MFKAPVLNVLPYIGLPFRLNGRTFTGIDCYGLVLLFYDLEFGIPLKDFTYFNAETMAKAFESASSTSDWVEVKEHRPGDVVVLRSGPWPCHCGIVIDGNRFLHAHDGACSSLARLDSGMWKCRITGYYRHAKRQ